MYQFCTKAKDISIHALLAESDSRITKQHINNLHFYPRSPCGERLGNIIITSLYKLFLSTLSLRRATPPSYNLMIHQKFLSTLSLRRATASITPTASRAKNFYPRSPCGERQRVKFKLNLVNEISIHALLAESDRTGGQSCNSTLVHFYPRSPCGERRKSRALKSRR